ncbi:universal stress protein [Paeniglutamicibacter antarcticus]|uniref:Universal stress protein n=1 Tax=Arthrobacter terrae TaxID=2935737 RepID=A0A931CVH8_9MICC|nr:universal stress protein [Arthrobacter terrae]MBG0740648.1 universal stress protein [Arthrobacter terrae]
MVTQDAQARIVVGLDGSDASIEALREAARLASLLGARVDAMTCWDFPGFYAAPYALNASDFESTARQVLDDSVQGAFDGDIPSNVSARLVQGPARSTLIDASKGAAMLVVGRRGRGGFGGLLLGSVSSACVAHAHCPVLVVHPPKEEGLPTYD